MALRACGHGARVAFVHFIKTGDPYGESVSAKSVAGLELESFGLGCVGAPGDTRERREHAEAAASALATAREKARSDLYDMLILDEVNVAVALGLIPLDGVLSLLDEKPRRLHVVLTGRDAAQEIITRADLVTEMKLVKHPYYEGHPPVKGIEY